MSLEDSFVPWEEFKSEIKSRGDLSESEREEIRNSVFRRLSKYHYTPTEKMDIANGILEEHDRYKENH